MTTTTTRPTYTLTVGGRDWVFTPTAIDVLSAAGLSPLLATMMIGATTAIGSGPTEISLGRVKVVVTRRGQRITVKPLEADEVEKKPAQSRADAPKSPTMASDVGKMPPPPKETR